MDVAIRMTCMERQVCILIVVEKPLQIQKGNQNSHEKNGFKRSLDLVKIGTGRTD